MNLQLAILFASCANVVAPTGGVKDTDAPRLVKAIPANESKNVTTKNFRITFNEFIKLKETEVIVSPPLSHPLIVKQKGKYIDVKWTDTLKPNTTYTFNFGDNITDYTEGNPYSNFKYVFSTGDKLDTLQLSGVVTDVVSGLGVEKIAVMLYDENYDSVVSKKRPYYFTKTNASGNFNFTNLKEGKYKLFGLKDENFNLLFDLPNEKIAFIDTLIQVKKQTNNQYLQLFENYSFKKQRIKSVQRLDAFSYLLKLEKKEKAHLTNDFPTYVEQFTGDSILIFFKQKPSVDSFGIVVKSSFIDTTFKIETKYDSVQLKRSRLIVSSNLSNTSTASGRKSTSTTTEKKVVNSNLNYGDALVLNFSHPVLSENLPAQFLLIEDTGKIKTNVPILSKASSINNFISINYPFKEDKIYEIIGRKNQFTDVCQIKNDSFHIQFTYIAQKHLGAIYILLTDSISSNHMIAELVNSSKQVVQSQIIKTNHIVWKNITPGNYKIRILVDENKDGEWTTGNYFQKHQPEKYIYYPKEILVKPNWDNELEWKLNQ